MKSKNIKRLTKQRVSWLEDNKGNCDIAISSRIRLARNLTSFPFPINATEKSSSEVLEKIKLAIENSKLFNKTFHIDMPTLNKKEVKILLERHLISVSFAEQKKDSALIINKKEDLAIMINEEDHLRMQAFKPGLQLNKAWKQINTFDTTLSQELAYSFDLSLGYLTSCPTNVGTAMRASVMLHLPALILAEQNQQLWQGVYKLGLVVRGIFGEGTDTLGNLFQISNQSTLGESEEDIIKRLNDVITQIIKHEKNARQKLLEVKPSFLLDKIGKAYGILKYSYIISIQEALTSLSMLRLGIDMGIIQAVSIQTLNDLFLTIFPAHLRAKYSLEMSTEEEDYYRAEIIRNSLSENKA